MPVASPPADHCIDRRRRVGCRRSTGDGHGERAPWLRAAIPAIVVGVVLGASASSSAATYPDAVLLVSGFNSASPFSTPSPSCEGREGTGWNPAGGAGVAPALKAAGVKVFTAPVKHANGSLPETCTGPGELAPLDDAVINSNGDVNANGMALATLLAFLRNEYGLERVQIVGHSDGGLWSRSAITQDAAFTGVEVRSLTTLGTPYTGSFAADLAIELNGGKCDFSNRFEQAICERVIRVAQLMLNDLGETVTEELTRNFLATWNPQQRIGSCPVTGIAGDAVGSKIGFPYYTPSDGAVGVASALAMESSDFHLKPIPAPGIPNFHQGGTYDVVHSDTLSFISPRNLRNTQGISDEVKQTVLANRANATPCNTSNGEAPPGKTRLGLPLYRFDVPDRRSRLPRPGAGDFVAALGGVGVKCGRKQLDSTRYRGDRRIELFATFGCEKPLRVAKGNGTAATDGAKATGRGNALVLDRVTRNKVLLKVDGSSARIRVRGPKVRRLRAAVLTGSDRQRLAIDRKGRVNLPDTGERTRLRFRARTKPGWVVSTAHATLSR